MEFNKGLIEGLLEQVNVLPIPAILFEHETRGMQLEINDGKIVDLIYDTDVTQF